MSGTKNPTGPKDFEVIQPNPPSLRDKVGEGGEVDPAAIARGEAALAAMLDGFIEATLNDLERMSSLIGSAAGCADAALMAHEIEGQGETFGFGLVTIIGGMVRQQLDEAVKAGRAGGPNVVAGISAIKTVLNERLTDIGSPRSKAVLASLGLKA